MVRGLPICSIAGLNNYDVYRLHTCFQGVASRKATLVDLRPSNYADSNV